MNESERLELLRLYQRKLFHYGKHHEHSFAALQAAGKFHDAEAALNKKLDEMKAKYPDEAIDLDKL